jgi:tubulin epsilon
LRHLKQADRRITKFIVVHGKFARTKARGPIMPRELITIQIGQCGNQLGCKFWDMALAEHAQYSPSGTFDESMSSFFRHVSSAGESAQEIPLGDGRQQLQWLRARAVLVDMEEGVLNEVLAGSLGDLFDSRQMIKDVSGSGNNWAHGHCVYGPKYDESILDTVRHATELCDSLQSFFLIHSLGGGTGSGLGTYILKMLEDNFEDVYRFTTSIIPSRADDVVTSPYNSMLSLRELAEHADCVLPMENKALIDACHLAGTLSERGSHRGGSGVVTSTIAHGGSDSVRRAGVQKDSRTDGFDAMNNIAAHVLTNLTCSMRFPGTLNVDLNEITTNLVPFPGLHFLMPSLSPIVTTMSDYHVGRDAVGGGSSWGRGAQASFDQVFSGSFSRKSQLVCADPRSHMYLACAVIVRGPYACVSTMQRNIERMKTKIKMAPWNLDGFKTGMCSTASIMAPKSSSALCLANNCAIAGTFRGIQEDFYRIYRRKAHVHHYTEYMEESMFEQANDAVCDLIESYDQLNAGNQFEVTSSRTKKLKSSTAGRGRSHEEGDDRAPPPQSSFFKRRGPVVGV